MNLPPEILYIVIQTKIIPDWRNDAALCPGSVFDLNQGRILYTSASCADICMEYGTAFQMRDDKSISEKNPIYLKLMPCPAHRLSIF